jgi:hypothetical protein
MAADKAGAMTNTSLIIVNAVLAAAVVAGILRLLLHGIHSDRSTGAHAVDATTFEADVRDRLAA